MALESIDKDKKYTYRDYQSWPEDERWEIIDGIPYMQAAPSWQHQRISRELLTQINIYLRGKECEVFAAPFDLLLPEDNKMDDDIQNIIQPDIVVICDKSKLKATGYGGVPPMIIEIVSPSSGKMDRLIKFNKYETAGVKEYWIAHPEEKTVMVFTLGENGRYGRPEIYSEDDDVKVGIFEDLSIDLKTVFS